MSRLATGNKTRTLMENPLYTKQLMQHHQNPQGWVEQLNTPLHRLESNAFCGDELLVGLEAESNRLSQIQFTGECCAVCRASSSLLHNYLIGSPIELSEQKVDAVIAAIQQESALPEALAPLQVIQQFPIRAQCARLPWLAIKKLISSHNVEDEKSLV